MAATRLEARLLGPLELRLGGVPRPPSGARQRALLALLLVHANETMSSDRLADALWDGSPPPTAQASLRVAISKLRRLLGEEHRHLLETAPDGYRLTIDPQQLDSARFESLLTEARTRPDEEAAALLDDALGLWRGQPLADLADHEFARAEADRLAGLRVVALEERAEAGLVLGRHEELVPELTALVEECPYRERPRAQLMLALYRSGRQVEALEVYRRGRRQLRDELGLEPGEELRRLERGDPRTRSCARHAEPGAAAGRARTPRSPPGAGPRDRRRRARGRERRHPRDARDRSLGGRRDRARPLARRHRAG